MLLWASHVSSWVASGTLCLSSLPPKRNMSQVATVTLIKKGTFAVIQTWPYNIHMFIFDNSVGWDIFKENGKIKLFFMRKEMMVFFLMFENSWGKCLRWLPPWIKWRVGCVSARIVTILFEVAQSYVYGETELRKILCLISHRHAVLDDKSCYVKSDTIFYKCRWQVAQVMVFLISEISLKR